MSWTTLVIFCICSVDSPFVDLSYRKVWLISAPSLISAYFLISAYIVPVLGYSVLSAWGSVALVQLERRFLRSRGAIGGWSWLALQFSRHLWVVIAKRLVGIAIQGSLSWRSWSSRRSSDSVYSYKHDGHEFTLVTWNCAVLNDSERQHRTCRRYKVLK